MPLAEVASQVQKTGGHQQGQAGEQIQSEHQLGAGPCMRVASQDELSEPEQGERREREQEDGAAGLVGFLATFDQFRNRSFVVAFGLAFLFRQPNHFVQSAVDQTFTTGVNGFIDDRAIMYDSVGEVTDQQDQSEGEDWRAEKPGGDKGHRQSESNRIAGRIGSVFFDDDPRQCDGPHRVHQDQIENAIRERSFVKQRDKEVRQAADHQENQHRPHADGGIICGFGTWATGQCGLALLSSLFRSFGVAATPAVHRRADFVHRDPLVSRFAALHQGLGIDLSLVDSIEQIRLTDRSNTTRFSQPTARHIKPLSGHRTSPATNEKCGGEKSSVGGSNLRKLPPGAPDHNRRFLHRIYSLTKIQLKLRNNWCCYCNHGRTFGGAEPAPRGDSASLSGGSLGGGRADGGWRCGEYIFAFRFLPPSSSWPRTSGFPPGNARSNRAGGTGGTSLTVKFAKFGPGCLDCCLILFDELR